MMFKIAGAASPGGKTKSRDFRRGFSPRGMFEYQALAASVAVVAAVSMLSASDQLR